MRLDVVLEVAIREEILWAHRALECAYFRMHRSHMGAHLDLLFEGFATEFTYEWFGHMSLVVSA